MDDAWIGVVGALGGVIVGGGSTFFIERLKLRAESARQRELRLRDRMEEVWLAFGRLLPALLDYEIDTESPDGPLAGSNEVRRQNIRIASEALLHLELSLRRLQIGSRSDVTRQRVTELVSDLEALDGSENAQWFETVVRAKIQQVGQGVESELSGE